MGGGEERSVILEGLYADHSLPALQPFRGFGPQIKVGKEAMASRPMVKSHLGATQKCVGLLQPVIP